ncbi:MAG: septum formation initiator family protein [Akkermansiaceae bacterium]|nr:septum formation initiator family protein [Akkermansiaceae bacterium]
MNLFRFLSSRRPTLVEQDRIKLLHSLGFRRVLAVGGLIFLAFVVYVGFLLALHQYLDLQSLKKDINRIDQRLNLMQEEEKAAHQRYLWMTDPEYYEQTARDRANMAKEGEKVIRPPEKKPTPAEPPANNKRN